MGNYKAYCFDGKDRVWVEDGLVAKSDNEAIELALAIRNAIKLEVRKERRIVSLIDRQFPSEEGCV